MLAGCTVEFILMLGYAVFLAIVAFLLEWAARHAHQRSRGAAVVGFTYHAERDIWRCPQDQHLFPVFSDAQRGVVIYRASAAACNSCRSKSACTDSDEGRRIERKTVNELEHGLLRFHRAMSLTLLLLASLILTIEIVRVDGRSPRLVLGSILALYCAIVRRVAADLLRPDRKPADGIRI